VVAAGAGAACSGRLVIKRSSPKALSQVGWLPRTITVNRPWTTEAVTGRKVGRRQGGSVAAGDECRQTTTTGSRGRARAGQDLSTTNTWSWPELSA
jgi:hypothetical protein